MLGSVVSILSPKETVEMVKIGKTRTNKPRSRSQKFKKAVLGRPQGAIQKRVQAVGPEKFGIVAVDCAKARSKWMLTDFYGNILNPPTNVEHDRSSFQLAMLTLKQAVEKHDIKDLIVAVEMTGTYHKPPMRAFRKAGYETRLSEEEIETTMSDSTSSRTRTAGIRRTVQQR